MEFNFTPRAYLDPELEDVSIVLDNALWEQRYWLPYRQEIEIRRRATWLDVPVRGIIRARWEIDGYVLNVGLAKSWFGGEEITFLPKAERDSFPWQTSIGAALEGVAGPGRRARLAPVGGGGGGGRGGRGGAGREGGRLAFRPGVGVRGGWGGSGGRESIGSLAVAAAPANGSFRPNPALGGVSVDVVQLAFERRSEGFAVQRDLSVEAVLEGGRPDGSDGYVRFASAGHVLLPAGAPRVLVRAAGGIASAALPAHRAFVLGGRGTLLGDPFRHWGGARLALLHLEWRVPVPFVSIGVGPYARTPRTLTIAPYVALGSPGPPVVGTPWAATPGLRTTPRLAVG